ncbi:hypothetical protein [Desulfosporosinus sp. BICA1-9]|uniref:hypothetical protein n=1 Tax=Desulfosporosinus sp. BICA1-9 TaxID=1531958 RepID=UPI00054BC306|nr:hypothetical protein [Desulfosporosinus sp. BICA1-9]KJS50563.1 MAG: hypothetical protein VR66_02065 [Peptococcaceae bacterium BRH_c23]KJS82829.1 MAG: hypothetical protein JL57_23710 [Desulfosporosinus sp. BICA1-9]
MNDLVKIRMEFYGQFVGIIGKKDMCFEVEPELEKAVGTIGRCLEMDYNIKIPYVLLLNDRLVSLIIKGGENQSINSGDVFKFVPVLSGG